MFSISTAEQLSKIFKAVGDPTRQKILLLLRQNGEMTVGDIVKHLKVAQPTVSQHLRILKEARAVLSRKSGQQIYYRLYSNRLCDALGEFIAIYQHETAQAGDQQK